VLIPVEPQARIPKRNGCIFAGYLVDRPVSTLRRGWRALLVLLANFDKEGVHSSRLDIILHD